MQNITTKKKIIYIAIAVVLTLIIAISTVLVLQSINSKKTDANQTQTTPNETNAAQKTEAIKLLNSDPAKAKEILTQLLQKYKDLGDTNNVKDVEAQLYLLDHPKTTK